MVGSALVRGLKAKGYDVLHADRSSLDLLDQKSVFDYLKSTTPDYIFVAAAKVGGIVANNTFRGQFIYENLQIANNLIHGAHLAGVQRLMFLGSSCIYPKLSPQPIKEEYLLTGSLEPTNEPYAIAKIAGVKMCEAYCAQYGRQYISVMPTNLYGPNDNYDLTNSHVLPALIRKFHLAKLVLVDDIAAVNRDIKMRGPIPWDVMEHLGLVSDIDGQLSRKAGTEPRVQVWGTGAPRREFLYVEDLADACIHLYESGYDGDLLNVGVGADVSIRELVEQVRISVGFEGELVFDITKPDGTPQKLLDVSKLDALGWRARTTLASGISLAYADYVSR